MARERMPGVICGYCQADMAGGHQPSCPEFIREMMEVQAPESEERCPDCRRPQSRGHDADCSEVMAMFGSVSD